MTAPSIPHLRADLQTHGRGGYVVLGVAAALIIGWGGLAQISGAVIAAGRVSGESSVKRIQHKEGGIIRDILVKEGQAVKAGQVMIRLDNTVTGANEAIVAAQILQLEARKARLEAERDARSSFALPATMSTNTEASAIMAGEQKLFTSRQLLRQQQKAQLNEQIRRSGQAAGGLEAQLASVTRQHAIIVKELASLKDLHSRGYAPQTRVNQFEREAESLQGQQGELRAQIAQAGTQASALRVQILQVDSEALSQIMAELKDTETQLAQLREQKVTTEDAVRRVEIRAPVDGKVQGLAVHTAGGVVTPAETLMNIVPAQDTLIIEARVNPRNIDEVETNKNVHVRFTSFATQSTPEALASIESVSSDVSTDERSGESFYTVRMVMNGQKLPERIKAKLTAGMPVEVQIETYERSAISYFLKPLTDQFSRAFRDE